MCLSDSWYSFIGSFYFHGNWVLDGCGDYFIFVTIGYMHMSWEFQRMLSLHNFSLESY